MNRRLRGSLLASVAGLAFPVAAFAQSVAYVQPALEQGAPGGDIEELISEESIISLTYAGNNGGDDIVITVQAFIVASDGTVTLVGAPRTIGEGAGGFTDIDNGTVGEVADDLDDATGPTNLLIDLGAYLDDGSGANLQADITSALDLAGVTQAVGLQITFTDAGGGAPVTTTNPTALTDGQFDEAATSPRILSSTIDIVQGVIDTSGTNPILTIELPQPLTTNLVSTNPNDLVEANIAQADLEVAAADTFAGAANPSALVAPGNATVVGTNNQALRFEFDPAGGDVPQVNEFIRFVGTDAVDFTGRSLTGDTNGIQIAIQQDLAFRSSGNGGGALVIDPTAGAPQIEVFFNQPVDQSFANVDFFEVDFLNSTAELYTDIAADQPGAVASVGPGSAPESLILTLNALPGELSIAPDGLIDDDDVTAGTFTDPVIAGETLSVFVDEGFAGADLNNTLGASFGGAGADDTGSTSVGDGIAPAAALFAFLDNEPGGTADGQISAFGIIFNEPVSFPAFTPGQFTIDINGGLNIQSLELIDQFGEFPAVLPTSEASTENAVTSVTGGFNLPNGSDITRLETGNAAVVVFGDTVDWTGDGAGTNTPGTNGPAGLFILDHPMFTVTDAAGNSTDVAANAAQAVGTDQAPPFANNFWFLTGDNINNNPAALNNIDQLLNEQGGINDIGDQDFNNLLAIVFGENLAAINNFDDLLTIDGSTFDANGVGTVSSPATVAGNTNILIVENRADSNSSGTITANDTAVANDDLLPGALISFEASNSTNTLPQDAAGNDIGIPGTPQPLVDNTSAFTNLIDDNAGGVLDSAFLIDDDNDDLVDRILLQLTDSIDTTGAGFNDSFNDFSVTAPAGITVTDIDPVAGNPASLFLTLGGSNLSINSENVTVEYDGAQAQDPNTDGDFADSRLLATVSGNSVAPVTSTLAGVEQVQIQSDGPFIAFQTFEGTATLASGAPFPVGTEITAYLGVPVVQTINTSHNGIDFTIDIRGNSSTSSGEESSIEAFIDYLYGLQNFVYLVRNEGNEQIFTNFKDDGGDSSTDDFEFARNIVEIFTPASFISISTAGVGNAVTFFGSGETGVTNSANGGFTLCWDVLRSSGGTLDSFFDSGYEVGGSAIPVGRTVITDTSGTYSIDVTGPDSRFNANSRINLNAVGRPIIFIATLPSGEVFALSSLASNISNPADGPINFTPSNTTQDAGSAVAPTTFNFTLANTGNQFISSGWDMLALPRVSGYANTIADIPVLPDGISNSNVATGSPFPFVDAFDQFIYWQDDDGDGVWEASDFDDGDFFIDEDCFGNFAFVADSFGVDLTPDALVGGGAAGFFSELSSTYGVAQFGPALEEASLFSSNSFPNNFTTQGWGTFVLTAPGGYANPAAILTANPDIDAFFLFDNDNGFVDIFNSLSSDSRSDIPQNSFGFFHFEQ